VNVLHSIVGLNPLPPNQHVFFVSNFPNLAILVEKNGFLKKNSKKNVNNKNIAKNLK
jgi:5-bromo-4-chloroindolyl phosphate hydrolysis protein